MEQEWKATLQKHGILRGGAWHNQHSLVAWLEGGARCICSNKAGLSLVIRYAEVEVVTGVSFGGGGGRSGLPG